MLTRACRNPIRRPLSRGVQRRTRRHSDHLLKNPVNARYLLRPYHESFGRNPPCTLEELYARFGVAGE